MLPITVPARTAAFIEGVAARAEADRAAAA